MKFNIRTDLIERELKESIVVLTSEKNKIESMLIRSIMILNDQDIVRLFKLVFHSKANISVNAEESHGMTILMIAAHYGKMEAVKFLIKHGANKDATDQEGKTALMYAVENEEFEVVKYLVKEGANKNIVDKSGKSAFKYAKKEEILEYLNRNENCRNGNMPLTHEGFHVIRSLEKCIIS